MIEPFTKRDFDATYADFERFWPGRSGLRALLHPIYLYQFGETASAIRDGDARVGPVPIITDYGGPGQHLVYVKRLGSTHDHTTGG